MGGHFISSIHFISLTAACAVKTGFKAKWEYLYGMQRQPGQPFLISHLIGVLARVLKPLAERPLSTAVRRRVVQS